MAVKTVDVSYKVGMSGPIVYSVELSNPVTGLQWQGTVGASGQVAEWSQMLERIKLWVEKAAPAGGGCRDGA